MSGIGGIVRWDGGPVSDSRLRTMMHLIGHRGPDGLTWKTGDGVGFGHALQALRRSETHRRPQPVSMPDGSCSIVADARIDNRDDVVRALGSVSWIREPASDAELILAGFDRWGEEVVHRIEGDFAFAIWLRDVRRLFAARDPFGARPLYYGRYPGAFVFGSEPKQILTLPEVPVAVDDLVVSEFLMLSFRETGRTFFETVNKLPPAHVLTAGAEGTAIKRYWSPGGCTDGDRADRPSDVAERFRELLIASVAHRLNTDLPAAAHLSGGIDSSSVVVAAAELYRGDLSDRPDICTVSAVFPGLDCDESALIQAVSNRVPFRALTYQPDSGPLLEGLEDELWVVDSPLVGVLRNAWRPEAGLLKELGVRSLLTGLGGDELLDDSNVLGDLVRSRRFDVWLRELQSTARAPAGSPRRALLAAARSLIPDRARGTLGAWRSRLSRQGPAWANADVVRRLAAHCTATEPSSVSSGTTGPSGSSIAGYLVRPHHVWGLEAANSRYASLGVDVTHPFLDRALAEFVVGLPLEARLPRGRQKALARRAFEGELPSEVRELGERVGYNQAVTRTLDAWWQVLPEELGPPERWQVSCYLDRGGLMPLYDDVVNRSTADVTLMEEMWRIAIVELWMRGLCRYNQVER
jgi:asparagine synthase (glutamine-hydrolysing)